jgi:hypothetical protein
MDATDIAAEQVRWRHAEAWLSGVDQEVMRAYRADAYPDIMDALEEAAMRQWARGNGIPLEPLEWVHGPSRPHQLRRSRGDSWSTWLMETRNPAIRTQGKDEWLALRSQLDDLIHAPITQKEQEWLAQRVRETPAEPEPQSVAYWQEWLEDHRPQDPQGQTQDEPWTEEDEREWERDLEKGRQQRGPQTDASSSLPMVRYMLTDDGELFTRPARNAQPQPFLVR